MLKAETFSSLADLRMLVGGPPSWVEDPGMRERISLNGEAVFVPATGGGGYLVGVHGGTALRVAVFGGDGLMGLDLAPMGGNPISSVSAALDASGVLHIAFVKGGTALSYARRDGEGAGRWRLADYDAPVGYELSSTAVVAEDSTTVSIYFTINATTNQWQLWRAKPVQLSGNLFVVHASRSPLVKFAHFAKPALCCSRNGGAGRLYYFGSDSGSEWELRRLQNEVTSVLQPVGSAVDCRGIRSAAPSDGRERIAWYDASTRVLHYLRPDSTADGPPYEAFQPVFGSGTQTNAALRGFVFAPGDIPCLLHRDGQGEDFVSYPRDPFDTDGNGREDLLDIAFGSPDAGLKVLPVGPAAPGLPFSEGRFNVTFPTIGQAVSDGDGGVVSMTENLRWGVEFSENATSWTSVDGVASFNRTGTVGSVRTYTIVSEDDAVPDFPRRFARLVVTRPEYPW
jgi:hypothetical protein